MFTYPLDKMTKDGKLFWCQPKRPPSAVTFDPAQELHRKFVVAFACLYARVFQITIPKESQVRGKEYEAVLAKEADQKTQKTFVPSQSKAETMNEQLQEKPGEEKVKEESMDDKEDIPLLRKKLLEALGKHKDKAVLTKAEEFEKDNDQNQHIDFIWAMANIRSSNYKLEPMDWMTVKIKAGRILPALATTTAAIAGL